MTKAGYTGTTLSRPQTLYKAPAFRELLSFLDDKVILGRLYEILMDEDKRSSLTAADMLLKLKDRYPANKLKVTAYQESLDDL